MLVVIRLFPATVVLLFFLFPIYLTAQLNVTEIFDAQEQAESVQMLLDEGVIINNVEVECGVGGFIDTLSAYGVFDGNDERLGMLGGILMTTGSAARAAGPNVPGSVASTSIVSGAPEFDAELDSLINFDINDICQTTVELIPLGDTLRFLYVFASEEYYGYTCSSLNDVFGLFVTGPKVNGGSYLNENMALIPDTDPPMPVSINTVNGGFGSLGGPCTSLGPNEGEECPCNSFYFIDNDFTAPGTNDNSNVSYRGFTRPMEVVFPVVPGATYTLKMAIADASDQALDSGVFIGEGSFFGGDAGISSDKPVGVNEEENLTVYFDYPAALFEKGFLTYEIVSCSGTAETAIMGEDFSFIETTLEVKEGSLIDSLVIDILADQEAEGLECFAIKLKTFETEDLVFQLGDDLLEVDIFDGDGGLGIAAQTEEVRVYPNPCRDRIFVSSFFGEKMSYDLYDHSGELLKADFLTKDYLDTKNLEPGVYFLQMKNTGSVHRFVKIN